MIPVLGVPAMQPLGLLADMLSTIDEPIGRLVIIDNTAEGEVASLDGPGDHVVLSPHQNLGVAASWNLIIKSTPRAPWWALVNFDLRFAPGDLGRLAAFMDEAVGTEKEGVAQLASFAAFGLHPSAIDRAGWFDENFVPAYCEDNDFVWRCQLTGVPIEVLEAGYEHLGSAVIRSSHHYNNQNNRTYPLNTAYYHQKWGGQMGNEVYTTPFNLGGDPAAWKLDRKRVTEMAWANP